MFERLVENRVVEALSDTPVVLIVGLRRAGKTTPVGWLSKAFFSPSFGSLLRAVAYPARFTAPDK